MRKKCATIGSISALMRHSEKVLDGADRLLWQLSGEMMRKETLWKGILFAAAVVVFGLLCAGILLFINEDSGYCAAALLLTPVYALGAALLLYGDRRQEGKLDLFWFCACLCMLALTLFARIALFPSVSDDFAEYLTPWLTEIRAMPGTTSLAADIGNYNMPYFYLLFAIGKLLSPAWDLYAIKGISILFDCVLAYFVMLLVQRKYPRKLIGAAAFFAALLVPSILVNGAMWGQCDSIFTAFALGGLYYGLEKKSRVSWAFFAIALSFKLQSVFLLPMLLVLLMAKRIRLRDAWAFFATFLALLLPAMLAGKSFLNCVTIYWRQANTYSQLSMLAPSVFAWLPEGTRSNIPVTAAGIFAAGSVTLGLLLYLFRRKERLDDESMIDAAYLFALLIPFLLPLMHERYFYAADAMAVVYLFCRPRRWYIPTLTCVASFLCHTAYLFDATTVPMWLLTFGMLSAVCLLTQQLIVRLEAKPATLLDCRE